MMKVVKLAAKICVIATAVALAVFAAGCVGPAKAKWVTDFKINAVRDTLSADVAAARASLIEEQNRLLAEMRAMFEEQKTASEMLRLMRADLLVRFNEIDRKASAIARSTEENTSRLSQMDRKTSEISRRQEQLASAADEAANQRKVQMEQLFGIAMSDFNAGRYDLAVSGFTDFAKQFPEAAQTPDAEYWIAEARFAKKDYETAEKDYMQLIKKYPDGAKSCAVFYKLGLVYEQQEKKKSMDMVWNNLLQRCPNSEEAQAVKSRK
jgi:tol-pal system protein YbgF